MHITGYVYVDLYYSMHKNNNITIKLSIIKHPFKWWTLCFSRIFHDLEIHNPNSRKTHVSNISHKVYTCIHISIWTPVTYAKYLFISRHNIHDIFAVILCKENSLMWPDPSSCRAVITCSIGTHAWPLQIL